MKKLIVVMAVLVGCSKPAEDGKPAAAKAVKKGEDAVAGEIIHKILTAEKMDVIPAARTIEMFKEVAEDQAAPDGCFWVYLKGQVTNKTAEEQSIKAISVLVVDNAGAKYEIATDTAHFVSSDRLPTSIKIAPSGSAEWEAYFPVKKGAKGLNFIGTDLSFLGEKTAKVDLGLE